MRLTDFLNEKITKKDMKNTFNNENIGIGAEFEFIHTAMVDASGSEELRDMYDRALDDGREYQEELRDLEQRFEDLDNEYDEIDAKIDDLDDKKSELEDELEDLDDDDDRKEEIQREIDSLEDERDELEDKMREIRDEQQDIDTQKMDTYIGGNYLDYMERVGYGGYDFEEPPDPDDMESSIENERTGIEIAQRELPDSIRDAMFIDDYEIAGYGDVKQDPGDTLGAFEYDNTVAQYGGVEMKSPPMRLPDFISILPRILDGIDDNGTTDNHTGLHFHMSVDDVNNIGMNIDMAKMVLFIEEDLIWKYFPSRMNSDYAYETKDKILRNMNPRNVKSYIADLLGDKKISPESLPELGRAHYDAIHQVGMAGTHVEFRYPGGANYHKKEKEIKNLIGRFAGTLSVGVDPEYRFKEYVRKIIRIFNKIDKIRLEKEYDALIKISSMTRKEFNEGFGKEVSDKQGNKIRKLIENEEKKYKKRLQNLKVSVSHGEKGEIERRVPFSMTDFVEKMKKMIG